MTIPRSLLIGLLVTFGSPAGYVLAQQNDAGGQATKAAAAAPKNVKLLTPDGLIDVMQGFNIALGVQCTYCHVAGDMASDANEHKQTARTMIGLVREIEPFFPTGGGPFPRGYHEVDCITCHRGSTMPETKTTYHFIRKSEAISPPKDNDPGTNLKVLPQKTPVHGANSIMEQFRDSLKVDCGYCHGGPGGFAGDANPRKNIARKMIELTMMVNSKFPGTGAYPEGKQVVNCYTCHRGDPHPDSLSNHSYEGPIPPIQ